MKILIGTKNKAKLKAISEAIEESPHFGSGIEIEGISADSGVSEQPKSIEETILGAKGRVTSMQKQGKSADFYIGLEGGVTLLDNTGFLFGFAAISNGTDIHIANSSMIPLPDYFTIELFQKDGDLGDIARNMSGDAEITHKGGTYGELTNGMITRDIAFKQAIHCALSPFFNKNYK